MSSDKTNSTNSTIGELLDQFSSGSPRKRRALVQSVESRAEEIPSLGSKALAPYDPEGHDWAAGWILQVLKRHYPEELGKLIPDISDGWFTSPSDVGIDYQPLQDSLLSENFEEADRFTSSVLRELAGEPAQSRGYVYFSEVPAMPDLDLCTLDRLWIAYSQGRFGFTVQASLLNSLGGRYDRLWPRIGWKKDGEWTRYPNSFDWSINAPEGHMPLINQLRGVRLMDAVLSHPALISRR